MLKKILLLGLLTAMILVFLPSASAEGGGPSPSGEGDTLSDCPGVLIDEDVIDLVSFLPGTRIQETGANGFDGESCFAINRGNPTADPDHPGN